MLWGVKPQRLLMNANRHTDKKSPCKNRGFFIDLNNFKSEAGGGGGSWTQSLKQSTYTKQTLDTHALPFDFRRLTVSSQQFNKFNFHRFFQSISKESTIILPVPFTRELGKFLKHVLIQIISQQVQKTIWQYIISDIISYPWAQMINHWSGCTGKFQPRHFLKSPELKQAICCESFRKGWMFPFPNPDRCRLSEPTATSWEYPMKTSPGELFTKYTQMLF